ncbi:MAG: TonB-dependent receptor [Bacteroidales bacterium]
MKNPVTLISLIIIFIQVQVLAQSQPDTIDLEDITIAVTPFEQRLSETTGSLSIIHTTEEEALHTINMADQLNTAPGVYMSSGTHTTNRLTIRGVGSRTPYSSNRIRAYFEEIPLTNGDGISTIEDMDISGISRIEILKGPASAMYGSGLGGVVKLRSIYPAQNGFSYQLSGDRGSFNTWKNSARIGWKKKNSSLVSGFTRATSDGHRENNRYRRNHFFLHGKTGTIKNSFTFHLLANDLYAEIPSSLNETDFQNNPGSAAANWLAMNGYKTYPKITGGATWKHTFNEHWQNRLTIFSSWQDPYETRPFNILDEDSFMGGLRNAVSYEKNGFRLQTGFELFHESFRWKIIESVSGEEGELQLHNSETRRYGNFFLHTGWTPITGLNLEGGLNVNMLNYHINTLYNVDGSDQSGSYSYNPVVSPRFGMNYRIVKDLYLHTSAGHGFSAPSLEETLLPEGLVNPDLRPETGWNFDLGFRGWMLKKRWYYDFTAYTIFIRDMLVTKRITEEIFTGINAGGAQLSGIEIYNRFRLHETASSSDWQNTIHSSIFLNSNRFTEFIDDETDHSNNALPGIPAQMIHLRFHAVYKESVELVAGTRFSGKEYLNDANTVDYTGHLITDVRVSWKIAVGKNPFGLRVNTGINNIFDVNYASMILVNAPSFGSAAPRYYYPGMPRNFFVSLSFEQ